MRSLESNQHLQPSSGLHRINLERTLLEYLPKVREIARRIHGHLPAQAPLDALVDAGVIGLIVAVDKLEFSKREEIQSYLLFRVRAAVLDKVREMDWSPRHLRRQSRYLDETRKKLQTEQEKSFTGPQSGVEPTICLEEFRQLLGEMHELGLGKTESTLSETRPDVRLLKGAANGNGPVQVAQNPLQACVREEIKVFLTDVLLDLDEKYRLTLSLYYLEELTLKEIAAVLRVSEETAAQMHSDCLARLWFKLDDRLRERQCATALPAFSFTN